jgi:ribose transport system substrate-binding protein
MVRNFTVRRWRRILGALMLVVSVAALTACGGSGESSSATGASTTARGSSTNTNNYQARLDSFYKGLYAPPKAPTVKAPTGKNIWHIASGLGVEYQVRSANATKEAAKKLGWKATVFDAKFDPNRMLTGVQQAIANKADGIILNSVDCPTVKTGIQQARKAGIPVVGIETLDCDPPLLNWVATYYQKGTLEKFDKLWGAAQAAWVIAKTNGKAKVVLNTETDLQTTRWAADGQKEELAKCSGCEVVADAKFVATDFGAKLQSKIQQAFLKHPEANSFLPSYDAVMTQGGGAQAIKATGRANQLEVGGGEGTAGGIVQVRNGTGMEMCAGQSAEWESYTAVDGLARLFLKRDPNELDSGNGLQNCDKENNLPAGGQPYEPPLDFRAGFAKLWGLS